MAPVQSGVKYSLLLFADMQPEEIQGFDPSRLRWTVSLVDRRGTGGALELGFIIGVSAKIPVFRHTCSSIFAAIPDFGVQFSCDLQPFSFLLELRHCVF